MDFPDRIPQKNIKQLAELLPGKTTPIIPNNAEKVSLASISDNDIRHSMREEAEDGDEMRGEQMRCATQ